MLKPLCGSQQTVDYILNEMGIPDYITCLLRNLYAGQEATELDMERCTGSKLGKEYIKAVLYPAYLIYMQSTSCKTLGWMKQQAGLKTARRNINNLIYADDTTLIAESEAELKSFLMKLKEESEKAGLKFQHSKN